MIFDSTQKFALKLCWASIDWICGDGRCKDIYVAVRFHEKYGNVEKFERKVVDHGFGMENKIKFLYNQLTCTEFIPHKDLSHI